MRCDDPCAGDAQFKGALRIIEISALSVRGAVRYAAVASSRDAAARDDILNLRRRQGLELRRKTLMDGISR